MRVDILKNKPRHRTADGMIERRCFRFNQRPYVYVSLLSAQGAYPLQWLCSCEDFKQVLLCVHLRLLNIRSKTQVNEVRVRAAAIRLQARGEFDVS